ncbi:MAG: MoaD/ThiS family protein [Wolinella sp.]
MVRVEFLGPIGKADMELEISSLSELRGILKNDKDVAMWLEDCAVAVNDTIVKSLDIPLKSGDKISLLPPVCGG